MQAHFGCKEGVGLRISLLAARGFGAVNPSDLSPCDIPAASGLSRILSCRGWAGWRAPCFPYNAWLSDDRAARSSNLPPGVMEPFQGLPSVLVAAMPS